MRRRLLWMSGLIAALWGTLTLWARPQIDVLNGGESSLKDVAPSDLARVLKQKSSALKGKFYNADTGALDYAAAAASPEFAEYVETANRLRDFDSAQLKTSEEKLAFWINLYNALTVDGIVAFQPKKSVWDVKGFFSKAAYNVGGRRFSLNDIENGVLRGNRRAPYALRRPFGRHDPRRAFSLSASEFDPRIHFALNCGSKSYPPFAFYDAEKIDQQLDIATRGFVRSETEVRGDALITSPIFNWYRSDFGDVTAFIVKRLDEETATRLRGTPVKVSFKRYDWGLNAR